MKKTLSLLAVILFFSFSLISQNVKITKGTEFKSEEGPKFDNFLGKDETGVYSLMHKQKATYVAYYIEKTDLKTLTPIYTIPFEGDIDEIYLVKNRILSFTTTYDKNEQKKYFLLEEFDSRTGKSLGDKKNVASLPSDPYGTNGRKFFITFSPDKSKMAVISELKWPKKTSEVSVTIYETATYKKVATKPLIDAYKGSTISSFNYRLDNNGSFYYLFYYMIDFEEEIGGLALTTIKSEATQSTVTPLPFDKLEIKNGAFEFVNDNLIFSGAFKDIVTRKEKKEGKEAKAGFYTFFIDGKTGEIKNKGFDYFTEDVASKLTYKDSDIKESPAGKKYGFEKIITINEDTYLIESHSYGITVSTSNSSKDFFTEREYIITKFNNKGRMQWMKVIPKFTVNLNDFNYIVKNNTIYLVYLDHPNNIKDIDINNYNPKKVEKVKNIDEANVVCTSIDDKGNLFRKELFLNNELFYLPSIENIIINNSELLIRLSRGKKGRFDKITID
jgi:hypothetical protein